MLDILVELKNLGIDSNSSLEDSRKAFRKLFFKFHPDTTKLTSLESNESFDKVREEYSNFLDLGIENLFRNLRNKNSNSISKEKILSILNDYIIFLTKSAKDLKNHNSIFLDSLPQLLEICNKLNLDFKEIIKPIITEIYLCELNHLNLLIENNLDKIKENMYLFKELLFLGNFLKRNLKKDFRQFGILILNFELKTIIKIKDKSLQIKKLKEVVDFIEFFGLSKNEIINLIEPFIKK